VGRGLANLQSPIANRQSAIVFPSSLGKSGVERYWRGLFPAGAVYWVATTVPPRNCASLLISMAAAPLVFLTAYWFGGLRQDQRGMLKERVRSLIR
jgi:hypothetical protein